MKKLVALLMAGVMVFGFAACGGNKDNGENQGNEQQNEEVKVDVADATELFNKVWTNYTETAGEDLQFFCMGGSMKEDGTFEDGKAGKFDHTKPEDTGMESQLCISADAIAMVDDAASLMHGMMVNNFTGAAYHVADKANTQAVVDGIKERTLNNQWMCGFPEKLIIVTVGEDYVISAFGNGMIIDAFKTSVTTVYGELASVVVEEALTE